MDGLPSIWRTELFHPMVVHFPIVLLSFGTVGWVAGQILSSRDGYEWLVPGGRALLWLGVITTWMAIYTGSLADAEVVRTLCDPTVVETHEELAYLVGYLFSGAVLVDGANLYFEWEGWSIMILRGMIGLTLFAGSGVLFYVGHLGATLVYQQGAGVYQPSKDCIEFD